MRLQTFQERFEYLQLNGYVGKETFGFERYLNQNFYRSKQWKDVRNYIIVRDSGCDLGVLGFEIPKGVKIFIHHMNPITVEDIRDNPFIALNPEFLILTTFQTHNAIHYGKYESARIPPVERFPNDTCPWRRS